MLNNKIKTSYNSKNKSSLAGAFNISFFTQQLLLFQRELLFLPQREHCR